MTKKAILFLSLLVSGCALGPKDVSLETRRAQFERTQLKTQKPVEVLWNSYGVPRVSAQTDADLFYAVGALQMHLRRSQLEFLRMISQGRVSEMLGGSTKGVDHFLRSLNFPQIAQRNWAHLSDGSKEALEQMARGMNDYIQQNPKKSVDLRLSGISETTWMAHDLATIHKFMSIDINWMMLSRVLKFVDQPYYHKLWDSWRGQESFIPLLFKNSDDKQASHSRPSWNTDSATALTSQPTLTLKSGVTTEPWLQSLTQALTRAGSNAFVVGKSKTGGAAILSNDPHLGIMIPNMWVFMVLESPSFKTMGFMMPTFPLPAVGRNAHIAWGGTNMWGLSTHLSEVSEESLQKASVREEHIKVRLGRDKKVKIREVDGLPIVTDIPLFSYSKPLALYWVGMETSDEVLAFFKINQSTTWTEFEQAFDTYAASGQFFLYADTKGNVGRVSALRQLQLDQDFKIPLAHVPKTKTFKNARDLPKVHNPPQGFVVSANDGLPIQKDKLPLALFHAPKDRVERMAELLAQRSRVSLQDVQEIQLDTFSQSAKDLSQSLLEVLTAQGDEVKDHPVTKVLEQWDGDYSLDSQGALVFEVLSARLMESYWGVIEKRLQMNSESLKDLYQFLTRSTRWRKDVQQALKMNRDFASSQEWITHLNVAQVRLNEYQNWGNFHPLTLAHPMSRIPLIGKKFKFYEGPYMGGNETLMKSAHSVSAIKAPVNFGAQARWMTDLSSEDENYFVLLGGQDGWLSSPNTNDQTSLWLQGKYIRVPFGKEAFLQSTGSADFRTP